MALDMFDLVLFVHLCGMCLPTTFIDLSVASSGILDTDEKI